MIIVVGFIGNDDFYLTILKDNSGTHETSMTTYIALFLIIVNLIFIRSKIENRISKLTQKKFYLIRNMK